MFVVEQETNKDGEGHEIRTSLYLQNETAQGTFYNALFIAWFRALRTPSGAYTVVTSHKERDDVGITAHEVAKAWFAEQRARIA